MISYWCALSYHEYNIVCYNSMITGVPLSYHDDCAHAYESIYMHIHIMNNITGVILLNDIVGY